MSLKVAVIAGGDSAESAISRSSANEVSRSLRERNVVELLELDENITSNITAFGPDVVFPVLHGPPGEDGTIQGYLEMLGLPYVGSDVRGSALAMDKYVAKTLFREAGLPVLEDLLVTVADVEGSSRLILGRFGQGVVIKPLRQGSALGVTRLPKGGDLSRPIMDARRYGDSVLVEPYFEGKEVTAAVLDLDGEERIVFPITEIELPDGEWYDFRNRYEVGRSVHKIPAALPATVLDDIANYASKAHECLGLRDLSRADFLVSENNEVVLLEVNTMPGMTPTSLYPDAAHAAGLSFDDLVDKLVASAVARVGNSLDT
ncbi:MAG: D-alanine--D-alanine ligase [Pseudomonadales bacterium]|nr:D-alanine--D-alanine ligase [Pseudomonadales bacterium]